MAGKDVFLEENKFYSQERHHRCYKKKPFFKKKEKLPFDIVSLINFFFLF